MREIKFRAWLDHGNGNGEMLPNIQNHINGDWAFGNIVNGNVANISEPMQFTGLLDKNGVEIYEGDVIKANAYPFYSDAPEILGGTDKPVELNYLGKVGIDENGVYYELHVVSDRVSGIACGGNLSEIVEAVEVIGNIHQNKELLPCKQQ